MVTFTGLWFSSQTTLSNFCSNHGLLGCDSFIHWHCTRKPCPQLVRLSFQRFLFCLQRSLVVFQLCPLLTQLIDRLCAGQQLFVRMCAVYFVCIEVLPFFGKWCLRTRVLYFDTPLMQHKVHQTIYHIILNNSLAPTLRKSHMP